MTWELLKQEKKKCGAEETLGTGRMEFGGELRKIYR